MSKVLVFGGTRFFGKDLVKTLIDNEYDVTIATILFMIIYVIALMQH
ncbi:hypothetical protein KQI86_00040 [Clostridium sp. MSJ-11]|uniref:Uncharacterized protein n=1 Tax=Clostridium mobile TaxID=2841512 RepID=A0ABS6ECA8_9CLOT|nr:hypothetical protein [Clostridium mobile]MBU5482690.1 hypothetical protein [Clostridium mobile]